MARSHAKLHALIPRSVSVRYRVASLAAKSLESGNLACWRFMWYLHDGVDVEGYTLVEGSGRTKVMKVLGVHPEFGGLLPLWNAKLALRTEQ